MFVYPDGVPTSLVYSYPRAAHNQCTPSCVVQIPPSTPGRLELFNDKLELPEEVDHAFANPSPISVVDRTPQLSARASIDTDSGAKEKYKNEYQNLNAVLELLNNESICKDTEISKLSMKLEQISAQLSEKKSSYDDLSVKVSSYVCIYWCVCIDYVGRALAPHISQTYLC